MKILHVTPHYYPAWTFGGTARVAYELTRGLAARGHEVTVFTTDALDMRRRILEEDHHGEHGGHGEALKLRALRALHALCGKSYFRVDVEGVRVFYFRNWSHALGARFNFSTPRGLAEAARELAPGFDLVHCHELRTVENLLVTPIAAAADVPLLLSPHGTIPHDTGRGVIKVGWDRLFGRRLTRRFRYVAALTEHEAGQFRELCAWLKLPLSPGPRFAATRGEGLDTSPPGLLSTRWRGGEPHDSAALAPPLHAMEREPGGEVNSRASFPFPPAWGKGPGIEGEQEVSVSVIPNGVHLADFDALPPRDVFRARHAIPDDAPLVLFLGRLHRRKGVHILIEALADAPGVWLAAAGPDAGARGELGALAARLGAAGRVVFTGFLGGADKLAALAAADGFALAAVGEGLSMAALEAGAAGLPLLLSEGCYMPEVAEAGAGEVLSYAPAGWAAALRRLTDAGRRASMGRAARRLVEARFTWPAVLDRLEAFYEEIVNRELRE
ncbi:MAG: glycosyltransferase [Anaerolineae bacterium]|nr:glycosyltransferase [Anaerolineae bacterium]